MYGPLAVSGTKEDRADKIMGVPWPAYRRPTAREIREAKEKAAKETPAANQLQRLRTLTWPKPGKNPRRPRKQGETAAAQTEEGEDAVKPILTTTAETPLMPDLPGAGETRSACLGIHDTASPSQEPRDLHTGQFIYHARKTKKLCFPPP